MFPFEFTVPGPPLSHQTRDRARLRAWKQTVSRAASRLWRGRSPVALNLRLKVTYYHEGLAIRIDNDNLLKPIQDALIGVVYVDDRQITDTMIRKTGIDGAFHIRGAS